MIKEWIYRIGSYYTVLFKIGTFGISSGIGFLVAEAILTAGAYFIFGSIKVKTFLSPSPGLLALDIFAFSIGVTVSFFINQTSFKWAELIEPTHALFRRLLRFQLVSWGSNALIIGIQLLLWREFFLSPFVGNIVGALATFPLAYLFSMRYIWIKSKPKSTDESELKEHQKL
ncbi:MAG: GtrA family protein [Thaumarchaeota archaeon]|nr:GtrA family protein [Nitrososphaerota archaeon]